MQICLLLSISMSVLQSVHLIPLCNMWDGDELQTVSSYHHSPTCNSYFRVSRWNKQQVCRGQPCWRVHCAWKPITLDVWDTSVLSLQTAINTTLCFPSNQDEHTGRGRAHYSTRTSHTIGKRLKYHLYVHKYHLQMIFIIKLEFVSLCLQGTRLLYACITRPAA